MTEVDEALGSFDWKDRQDTERLTGMLDLIASAGAVQALKAWALEALAPAAGDSALDVGCGTGEDVRVFGRLVGTNGRAVGVEPNAGLRAEAERRAGGSVELVDGDAYTLPFEDASFDVIRCERVLQHLDHPDRAVGEMARVLKPGGRVALIDTDWRTAILHPVDPEVLSRMIADFEARAANPFSGRRLRGLLAGAGLSVRDETAATWIDAQSGATGGFATVMSANALAAGVISQAEADAFNAGLAEAAERDAFHFSLTMYAVAATKP